MVAHNGLNLAGLGFELQICVLSIRPLRPLIFPSRNLIVAYIDYLSKLELKLDNRYSLKKLNAALLKLINILFKIKKRQFINYSDR